MARFTLYHCKDARSLRALWALKELQLTNYKLVNLRFPPRVHHKEDFLRVNPLGTIPWMVDEERGHSIGMSESCAIPLYLASAVAPESGLSVLPEEQSYMQFLNWCFHADATLTFPQTLLLRYGTHEPGRAEAAAIDYTRWFHARLKLLNGALADGRTFLCADRFTVADINVTYALFFGTTLLDLESGEPLSASYKPSVASYLARMVARPSFIAARSEQE